MIEWVLSWIWWFPGWAWRQIIDWAQRNPTSAALIGLAIVRSFGTTVQTGWAGVLFTAGRARKVLEPGFHPLIPILQKVRLTPVRSITLDLPRQRVTTADGLVYDVHANIVYRVIDPIKAMIQIDNIRRGVLTLVPLVIHSLMRRHDGQTLANPQSLDGELKAATKESLSRWGIDVEQAGLATIAPTRQTIRLTQLSVRMRERVALLHANLASNAPEMVALAFATAIRAPIGKSHAAYHRRKHLGRFATRSARELLLRAELPKVAGVVVLKAEVMRTTERHVARSTLRLIWEREKWPLSDLGFAEFDAILDMASTEGEGFDLPYGIQVRREGAHLTLGYPRIDGSRLNVQHSSLVLA